ncbi:ribokinase [Xylocopilactobacillus apis]|uniref:Ribokinase n=1 Tax=Xylocopilactobacillus apis TaxID=2932183 RepID=A0AAU9D4Y6_9LACO|nr:ribokinase [Xylocopilactobacillus apis]BDR57350.1 ribokinase [Xylocopilactobacillus apis]
MKKIAVVGSANMDLMLTLDRFPEVGETVLGKNYQYTFGGKGANQAVAVKRLGGDVKFFARLGKDDNGQKMENNFKKENLPVVIAHSNLHSGFATIINFQQDNRIMVFSGCNMESTPEYEQQIQNQLAEFDLILLQCEIAPSLNFAVAKWGHEHGKTVILNPAPVDKFETRILPYVDYLLPNETEAALILKENQNLDLNKIITTQGSLGASYTKDNKQYLVPALHGLNVVDTTGAGDAFVGGFVYGLANDYPISKCVMCGNITGGKNTESLGATTGMIDQKTLNELLNSQA